MRTSDFRKKQHLYNIKAKSHVRGRDILHFDDDWRQVAVENLGVCMYLTGTSKGEFQIINTKIIDDGVWQWRARLNITNPHTAGIKI